MSVAGTLSFAPPELFKEGLYEAAPTTVWQLGAILFEMMDGFERFDTTMFCCSDITISDELPKGKKTVCIRHHTASLQPQV